MQNAEAAPVTGNAVRRVVIAGYDDGSNYLPCDRALAFETIVDEPAQPRTRYAHTAGWRGHIPVPA